MPRHLAFDLLRGTSPSPLRDLDAEARRRGLDARDRGLARRIVATCLRRRGNLLALVRTFARGKPKPDLAALLHIGLAQLLFLDRIPDHAAVSTTVEAASDALGLSKGRIVNGILRTVVRARRAGPSGDPRRDLVGTPWTLDVDVFRDPREHPFLWGEDALSMPAPILKAWSERFGRERAEELARAALDEPPLSVRILAQDEPTVEAVASELAALEPAPLARRGRDLVFPAAATEAVVGSPAFARGDATIQGAAAARAADLVGAAAGQRVLDLCAAPGGKAVAMARAGATVAAVDVDAQRLERVRDNARRLRVEERVSVHVADGTDLGRTAPELVQGGFDAVLVDAPCSNSGVFAARPEARWRFGPTNQRSLVELQERLVREAARHVRTGGALVWSTCSIEPGENQALVARFLREHPNFEQVAEHLTLPERPGPPADGGYAARLERRS
jgi:16S rRNA (cytosine967-C5)-methyltransferase